jgi:hypothetical protein
MRQLSEMLRQDMSAEELERRRLSKLVLPYVKAYYDGYIDLERHEPFYRMSARS